MISSTIAHYLDHYRKMYFETSPKRFTIESVIQWESIRILSIALGIRAIYLFIYLSVSTVNNANCYLISQIILLSW